MSDHADHHHEPPFADAAGYDALADLFLSERPTRTPPTSAPTTYGAEIPTEPVPRAEPQQVAGNSPSTGPQHEPHEVSEPVLRVESAPMEAKREEGPQAPGSGGAGTHIELLIAGHLPILGGPWLAQYADRLAEAEGPVALVQIRQGTVSLELFHPPMEAEAAQRLRASAAQESTLEDAILAVTARAARWLVRSDEVLVAGLVGAVAASRLTIVSAADEAAVVASYRTLKELSATARERQGREPTWRCVIAGSEAQAADSAFARLAASTQRFLDLEIKRGPSIERLRPLVVEQLGRWELTRSPAEVVALIEAARELQSEEGEQLQVNAESAASARGGLSADELSFLDELSLDAPTYAAGSDESPAKPDKMPDDGAADDQGAEALCLAAELGFTPLVARCPRAGEIQLAVDDAGRLQVLGHQGTAEALALLLAASAWALEHQALLSLAQPGVEIDSEAEPVLHLFTDAAPQVRNLLDSKVRLHLLLRSAWERRRSNVVCADLN